MASKAGGVTELLRCVERSSDSGEWQNLQWFSISRHSIPEIPAQFCRRLIWHRLRTADDVMIRAFQHRMTLEQLKRHMDRRLDRLQRTKADKSDLKRFATKSQFRRLRMDLKRFATKSAITYPLLSDALQRSMISNASRRRTISNSSSNGTRRKRRRERSRLKCFAGSTASTTRSTASCEGSTMCTTRTTAR